MTDTEKEAVRAMARAIVAADAGTTTLPEAALSAMRDAVKAAAPHCTPEQIANNECAGA